ncbi:hypothetical protein HGR_15494 [Hylemonella gracilis ATCC 19624]|uniref:Nucleoside 2-deoxyribosyltransferase n=2 Tax=Hylemonella gracilis TaxID=80880 RepID=F3KXA9_9BURK|nr:hypothetical protein HGR_15494 [Hylemonella gracilis ATCC 19624]
MPIADVAGYEAGHFGRVYEHVIKPAVLAAGFTPVRADDAVKTDYIVVSIIQQIVDSAMVVCDFSGRNPNVMYELGIRHAFNKPVVLIKDRRTEKIFDIQGLRYAEYDEILRIDTVKKDVARITAAIEETSKSSEKDLNSIVRLAGIKTAEVPASQTISPDTKLLLSAIESIDRRVQSMEKMDVPMQIHFIVDGEIVRFSDGSEVTPGADLYKNGREFGTLMALNPESQLITIQLTGGKIIDIPPHSPMAKGLTDLPF